MNRNKNLDLIRDVAIFLVVLNHCGETCYNLNSFGEILPMGGILSFSVGRLGVPLFFLLSGYLLLKREYRTFADTKRFWRHKFGLLLANWEIWILLYFIFLAILGRYPFFSISSFGYLLKQMCFALPVPIMHSWYVPALLGLYFFYPVIAKILHKINDSELLILFSFTYIVAFVLPTIAILLNGGCVLSTGFSGGAYGFLIVFGYWFSRHPIPRFGKIQCSLYAFLSLGVIVGFQVILRLCGKIYNVWYDFAAIPFAAYFLFFLLAQIRISDTFGRISARLSTASYGIYLVHCPVLLLLQDLIRPLFRRSVGMVVLLIVVFFVSWAIVEGIRCIPRLRKYLVLVKE
jgi:surface polysaccharide O-acyltransferase-like enzyme